MEPGARLSHDSGKLAVELAKAGMSNNATFLNHPELIATFVEVVAKKIESIKA
jgi:hypothetical protein